MSSAQFPIRRMRRLRRTAALRRLVAGTHVVPSQLVWPQFVVHGEGVRRPIATLPGVAQLSVDQLVKDAERAASLGLGGVILFGIPATKDGTGSEAHDDQGIVQQAIRAVKRRFRICLFTAKAACAGTPIQDNGAVSGTATAVTNRSGNWLGKT